MRWNLDQLEQFVTAARLGSFSGAARALGKAQSAVSTAIGLLEADLGLELFDRSRGRAQLSDAGQLLLLQAQQLLQQAQALDRRAQAFNRGAQPRLALALDEALPFAAVRTLVRELAEKFPHLELGLLNGTASEVAEYAQLGYADIALQCDRGPLEASFAQNHIGVLEQAAFVAKTHELAAKASIEHADLQDLRQILIHATDVGATAYSARVWRCDSYYTIAELVAERLGWAILPVAVAQDGANNLQRLHCPFLSLSKLSIRAIWLHGTDSGAAGAWVKSRFAQILAGEHA